VPISGHCDGSLLGYDNTHLEAGPEELDGVGGALAVHRAAVHVVLKLQRHLPRSENHNVLETSLPGFHESPYRLVR
jgi:hypothetical protein